MWHWSTGGTTQQNALAEGETDRESTDIAWMRISVEAKATYEGVKEALLNRFEPESKRELYSAQSQSDGQRVGPNCMPTTSTQKISLVSQEKQGVLWRVAEESRKKLDEAERNQLYFLLTTYADVFSCSDDELGHTGKLKHSTDTGNHQSATS